MMQNKFVFGITGPTGAGKTTVSGVFSRLGAYVIDADVVARAVMEPGSKCLSELKAVFGEGITDADGRLLRKKLADIVFSDEAKLQKLNSVSHKYITREINYRILSSHAKMIAIDGAVLIGSGADKLCRCIVSVIADEQTRIKRICERDGITETDAQMRINSQKSNQFYIENSDYIIYNNIYDDLPRQIKEVWTQLEKRSEGAPAAE